MAILSREELQRQRSLAGLPPLDAEPPVEGRRPIEISVSEPSRNVPKTIREAVTGKTADDIVSQARRAVEIARSSNEKYADLSDNEVFDDLKDKYPDLVGKLYMKKGTLDQADTIVSSFVRGAAAMPFQTAEGVGKSIQSIGDYLTETPPWRINPNYFAADNLESLGRHLQRQKPLDLNPAAILTTLNPSSLAANVIASQPKMIGEALLDTSARVKQIQYEAETKLGLPHEVPKVWKDAGKAIADAGAFASDWGEHVQQSNEFLQSPSKDEDPLGYYSFGVGSGTAQVAGAVLTGRIGTLLGLAPKAAVYLSAITPALADMGGVYKDAEKWAIENGFPKSDARNFAWAYGIASYKVESMSLDVLLETNPKKALGKLFGKGFAEKVAKAIGTKAAKNPFIKKAIENKVLKIATSLAIGGQAEGAEEALQTTLDYVIGNFAGYRNFKDYTQTLWDSYVMGSIAGALGKSMAYIPPTLKERAYVLNEHLKSLDEKLKAEGVKQSALDQAKKAVKNVVKKGVKDADIHQAIFDYVQTVMTSRVNPGDTDLEMEVERTPKIIFSNQGQREYYPVDLADKSFVKSSVDRWNEEHPDRIILYDDSGKEGARGLTQVQKDLIEGALVANQGAFSTDNERQDFLMKVIDLVTGPRVVSFEDGNPGDPDIRVNYMGQNMTKQAFHEWLKKDRVNPKGIRVLYSGVKGAPDVDIKEFIKSAEADAPVGGWNEPEPLVEFSLLTNISGFLSPKELRERYGDVFMDGAEDSESIYKDLRDMMNFPEANRVIKKAGLFSLTPSIPPVIMREIIEAASRTGKYKNITEDDAVAVVQHLASDYVVVMKPAQERGDIQDWRKEREKWVVTEGTFSKDVYYRGLDPSTPDEKKTIGIGHYTTNPFEAEDFATTRNDNTERNNPVVKKVEIKVGKKDVLDLSNYNPQTFKAEMLRRNFPEELVDDLMKQIDAHGDYTTGEYFPLYMKANALGFKAVKFDSPLNAESGKSFVLVPLTSAIVKPVKDFYLSKNNYYDEISKARSFVSQTYSTKLLNAVRLRMNIAGRGDIRVLDGSVLNKRITDKIVPGSENYLKMLSYYADDIEEAKRNGQLPILFTEAVLVNVGDEAVVSAAMWDPLQGVIIFSESGLKELYDMWQKGEAGDYWPNPKDVSISPEQFRNLILEHEKVHAIANIDGSDMDERLVNIIAMERIGLGREAEVFRKQVEGNARKNNLRDLSDTATSVPAVAVTQDEHLWQPPGDLMPLVIEPGVQTYDTGFGMIDVDANTGIIVNAEQGVAQLIGKPYASVADQGFTPVTAQEKKIRTDRKMRADQIFLNLFSLIKNLNKEQAEQVASVYEDFKRNRATDMDVLYVILDAAYDLPATAALISEFKDKFLQNKRLELNVNSVQNYLAPDAQVDADGGEVMPDHDIDLEALTETRNKWTDAYPNVPPEKVLEVYDKGKPDQKAKFEKELANMGLSIQDLRNLADNPLEPAADDSIEDIFNRAQEKHNYAIKNEYYYEESVAREERDDIEHEDRLDQQDYSERLKLRADQTTEVKDSEVDQFENGGDDFMFDRDNISSTQVSDSMLFLSYQDRAISFINRIASKKAYIRFIGLLADMVKQSTLEGLSIEQMSEAFQGELADLNNFSKRTAEVNDDALYRLGVDLWYGESVKKTTSADNLRARIKSLVDSLPNQEKVLKSYEEALGSLDKEMQDFFQDRQARVKAVRANKLSNYGRMVRDYTNWISNLAPAAWESFKANGYKNRVIDDMTARNRVDNSWMAGTVTDSKKAPSPNLGKLSKLNQIQVKATAFFQGEGKAWEMFDEKVIEQTINAAEFQGVRDTIKHEIGKARGRFDFSTVMDYMASSITQGYILDYYKKKGVKNAEEMAKKAFHYLRYADQEIYVPYTSNGTRYAVSNVGKGGLHPTKSAQTAFLDVYPDAFEFFAGRSLTPTEMSRIQFERPALAMWNVVPVDLKRLLIWNKATLINPVVRLAESMGVLDHANIYNNQRSGWSARHAQINEKQTPGGSRPVVNKAKNPSRNYWSEEEYSYYSVLGQSEKDPVTGEVQKHHFVVDDYPQALGYYMKKTWDKIIAANLLNDLGKLVNPQNPDLKVVEYAMDVRDKLKAMGVSASDDNVYEYLSKNGYTQPHGMPGLAKHKRGTFQAPWVHRTAVPLIERLTDVSEGDINKSLNFLANINRLNKIIVIPFPAMFALQIYSGMVFGRVKISEQAKSLIKIFTSAAPFTGGALGAMAGGIPGALIGSLIGVGATYFMPGLARKTAERLMGIARPWEGFQDWDPKTLTHMFESNVQMAVMGSAVRNVYDRMNTLQDKDIPGVQDFNKRFRHFLGSKFGMDDYIFDDVIRKMVYLYFKSEFERNVKKGMPEERAASAAGHLVNRTAGSVSAYAMSADARVLLRAALFAVDFTVSGISTMYGSILGAKEFMLDGFGALGLNVERFRTKGGKTPTTMAGKLAEPFLLGDMTTQQKRDFSKRAFTWVFASSLLLIFTKTLAQLALQSFAGPPDDDDEDEKESFLKKLLNERGRQLDLKLPFKSRNGNPVYAIMPTFKELKEIQQITGAWAEDTWNLEVFWHSLSNYIGGKLGFTPKLIAGTIQNFAGEPGKIETYDPNWLEEISPRYIDITGRVPYGDESVISPAQMAWMSQGLTPMEGLDADVEFLRWKRLNRRNRGREKSKTSGLKNAKREGGGYDKVLESGVSPERILKEDLRRHDKRYAYWKQNNSGIKEEAAREARLKHNLVERILGTELPWREKERG